MKVKDKMSKNIVFKIESAENMSEDKIVILTNPCNEEMLDKFLYVIKKYIKAEFDEEK